MYHATFSSSSNAAMNSDGSRSGDTRHSTISSRVSPFTALTAVDRLAVNSSEPTWVAASLPVFRSITCAKLVGNLAPEEVVGLVATVEGRDVSRLEVLGVRETAT